MAIVIVELIELEGQYDIRLAETGEVVGYIYGIDETWFWSVYEEEEVEERSLLKVKEAVAKRMSTKTVDDVKSGYSGPMYEDVTFQSKSSPSVPNKIEIRDSGKRRDRNWFGRIFERFSWRHDDGFDPRPR